MSSRLVLSVSLGGLILCLSQAERADACGLKLTVRGFKPAKGVEPSENPSRILIVGQPPPKLEESLSRAGHYVKVVDDLRQAKGGSYSVVMVTSDSAKAQAELQFPQASALKMAANTRLNVRSLETTLSRTVVGRSVSRTVLASSTPKKPIAAGPEWNAPLATSAPPGDLMRSGGGGAVSAPIAASPANNQAGASPVAPSTVLGKQDKPDGTPVLAVATHTVEPPRKEPTSVPPAPPMDSDVGSGPRADAQREPAHFASVISKPPRPMLASRSFAVAGSASESGDDGPTGIEAQALFFGAGSSKLTRTAKHRLGTHVDWLRSNPQARVSIEGHADIAGSAASNLVLSRDRSESAREYLVATGIETGRIDVVAHGEERPVFGVGTSSNNRCVIVSRILAP